VERSINNLSGIQSIDVNLSDKQVTVEFDDHQTSIEDIKNAVEDMGYDVE
jgi:copper chaperone CopZ